LFAEAPRSETMNILLKNHLIKTTDEAAPEVFIFLSTNMNNSARCYSLKKS